MGWRLLFYLCFFVKINGDLIFSNCKRAVFEKREGIFYSVGFPKPIEPPQCFVYHFQAPPEKHVQLTFETVEVPSSLGSKCLDFIRIYDAPKSNFIDENSKNYDEFCGKKSFGSNQDFVSAANHLFLVIQAEISRSVRINGSYQFLDSSKYQSDVQKLAPKTCEFRASALKGQIWSPNAPYFVPENLNWLNTSELRCEEMDHVASHVLVGSRMSKIFDFCGSEIPPPLMSAKNILTLEYVVKSNEGTRQPQPEDDFGFVIEYKFLTNWGNQPKETIVDQSKSCNFAFNSTVQKIGHFWSPNHPGFYPRNLDCEYVFHGKDGQIVVIHFEYFDVEGFGQCEDSTHSDFVLFSNYKTTDRTNRRYCGGMKPPGAIASESNYFRMLFRTNDIFDGTGFYGHYQFVDQQASQSNNVKLATASAPTATVQTAMLVALAGSMVSLHWPLWH
uniref:CUB domain-containing protein n=1 Tax=Panagrolaimus sp. JU765 TaxID=591449 RepID=A0AC34QXB8_9BILA